MSDYSISLVPKISNYPNNESKAQEILNWLIAQDIVKPVISDCALGTGGGHAIAEGARKIVQHPEDLPFGLITQGLEIVVTRTIFDAGENGMDDITCPTCKENIVAGDWNLTPWQKHESDEMICPQCGVSNEINAYVFSPEWGFSNLGFTFWNWPEFTNDFLQQFKQKLGCEIAVVYDHI